MGIVWEGTPPSIYRLHQKRSDRLLKGLCLLGYHAPQAAVIRLESSRLGKVVSRCRRCGQIR